MKKIIDKIKKFGIIETIVFLLYIVCVLVIVSTHECYEDETQSWLIARDLNPLEIINQMKYEGHSFLWYFILVPFAKLGFPVGIQKYISCAFAIATVFLILKKAPFSKFIKILLTFSPGMIFFYSAIARPYCMIPFFLACISIVYKDRKQHPYLYGSLIALLANTHIIMMPTACLLTLMFWGNELILKRKENTTEQKKTLIKSFLIPVLGIAIFLAIVFFTMFNCEIIGNFDRTDKIFKFKSLVAELKLTCSRTVRYLYGAERVPKYYNIIILIDVLLCVIGTKNNLKQGLIFWSQLICTILIHTLSWFILATRVMIVIYTMMFWLWNYKEDKQYKKKPKENWWIKLALITLIIASAPATYKLAYQDIKSNYSTGKITAEYIKENIPKNSCFICSEQELQQSVVAYLKKDDYKFYMPNSEQFVTFITWDKKWQEYITPDKMENAIRKMKNTFDNVYIIGYHSFFREEPYEMIFSSENEWIDNFYARKEVYDIYKIK